MKKIIGIFCLCSIILSVSAQVTKVIKPASLTFHTFYIDFKTAQQIKASSLGDVLKNGNWNNFGEMQMGFGFTYFKGLNPVIDFVSTLDAGSIDYTFKDGTTNGSSKFLLDANAGVNLKLSNDSKTVVPYLFGGAGISYYKKMGVYVPVGLGVQVNVFNEAFITANMQYKIAASSTVNHHFYYNVGIGLPIGKSKKVKPIEKEVIAPIEPVVIAKPVEIKLIKDLRVIVVDEQTGLPLPNVMISLVSDSGTVVLASNQDGEVVFKNNLAGNYTISGKLNGINTGLQNLLKENFETANERVSIQLSHNDPRFTLSGMVEERNTQAPMNSVLVSITDKTLEKTSTVESNALNGKFTVQLAANSDFVLSAKKANYISNIEQISTKGLNRSTTLYVKLVLAIEETKANATINLKNIYYATGSSQIKQEASSDLNRLVLFLTDNPSISIEIASHSDSRGSAATNLVLSQKRVLEVFNYLNGKGINAKRMRAMGYGETKLLNKCRDGVKCTEEQHEQNRRTEFKVIGN